MVTRREAELAYRMTGRRIASLLLAVVVLTPLPK